MKKIFSLLFACLMVSAAMAYETIPDHLYIIGGATRDAGNASDNGWVNPIELTKLDDGTFTTTRYFAVGDGYDSQFKFLTSTGGDKFDQLSFGPYECDNVGSDFKGVERNNTYSLRAFKAGTDDWGDYKFYVSAGGYYTVHVDVANNKLSTWPIFLCPTGDGCDNGWVGNAQHTAKWRESSLGSGIYEGDVTVNTDGTQRELLFTVDDKYEYYVGPSTFNQWNHNDILDAGEFDIAVRQNSEGEKRWYILDEANGKSFHAKIDLNTNKLYLSKDVTIRAQITKEAVAALGSVKCFAWTTVGGEAKDMNLVDGFYTATFSTYMPLNFLIYNGRFKYEDGGVQSVDMTHDGNGYFEDKCVNLISRRTSNNELMCFHNDGCELNTNSYTVNIYVEDAGWSDVYFFTQNAGDQNEYQNVFTHAVKGDDNWYSYTFDKAENMKWVATATTENWNTQVNDIENVNADKYYYVTPDKHDNGHNKIVSLSGKEELKEYTFSFKFDGAARSSWGEENPVGLYYWQAYAMDGEEVADHANTIQMTKNSEDVYTATVKALNHVKFCVQSDLAQGYHGEGHYTLEVDAAEQTTGFVEDKMFWIRDNGSYHYVALTENYDPRTMTVNLNSDGFASIYMAYDFTLPKGVAAYSGQLVGDEIDLHEVLQSNLPRETGLILYSASHLGQSITLTECLDGAAAVSDNAFTGTLTGTTERGVYVLGHTAEPYSTAFYYMADDITIPANRAYLKVQGGSGAPLRMRFVNNVTTDMEECQVHSTKCIIDGRLYILRDGKKYTVTGQVEY